MDYNSDFNSETWLAEKIFSQLKEFNPNDEARENEMDVLPLKTETIPTSSEGNMGGISIGATNGITDIQVGGVLDQQQNLSIKMSNDTIANQMEIGSRRIQENLSSASSGFISIEHDKVLNLSKSSRQCLTTDTNEILQQNLHPKVECSTLIPDNTAVAATTGSDGNNIIDQRYLDLILASLPDAEEQAESIIIINEESGTVKNEQYDIACAHCDQAFTEEDFSRHICEYDDNKNYIRDEEQPVKYNSRPDEIIEPPCIKQLRENNARIRKFLKEELKIDLGGSEKKLSGPHECMMCERKFVHASGLTRHMEKHALDLIPVSTNTSHTQSGLRVVVKCLVCGRLFFGHIDAMKHITEDHQNWDDDDDDGSDGEQEISLDKLKEAIELVNKELNPQNNVSAEEEEKYISTNPYLKVIILSSVLQCEFCDYIFSEVSHLLLHSSTHEPIQGFECNSCGINVCTFKEIFLHWQAECPYSRDEIKRNFNLQKYFVCNVCENKFTSHEQLYDHRYSAYHLFPRLNSSSGILQMRCEYCGTLHDRAQVTIRHYEEKHMKKVKKETTSKYRQYLCDVCGKSYTQSSHLWQHLRFHRGVKPFACKEPGCNRRFTIRPDLNDHIRKCHTGERPYHCLVCGKRFLTGSVFYQHRLIHRGERRYGCDECGKRFYRADALKNHQRIHTGEKPYGCMYCNKSFRQRGDRDKHIRARHANFDPNVRALTMRNRGQQSKDGVVYVGNFAFPTSMFKPMVSDIDGC